EFLLQLRVEFANAVNMSSRLRCLRTKTGNACSALRPFARQRSPRRHSHWARRPSAQPKIVPIDPTEPHDELAAHHSITSSARASTVGGTVSPSVLAVLRLITSSYLVGFCTGSSDGFSPLRMRST